MAQAIAALLLCAGVNCAAAERMWTELAPASGGSAGFTTLARYAAASGSVCPAVSFDGRSTKMKRRAPTGNFAAFICEATVPEGTKRASIHRLPLPLPRWKPDGKPNIVVIGDTGCRIKKGSDDAPASADARWNIQNCAGPEDWPFQEVASQAAFAQPDLVIHVGDYLYREKNCAGVKDCPGGPAGDTFETWEADFFAPAQKLLRAAPWVFVRGNHETCGRAGDGWFSLLDPRDSPTCREFTAPYLLNAGSLPLAVLDDSTASDAACAPDNPKCQTQFAREAAEYTAQFQTVSSWKLGHAWMLLHRPVWSVKKGGDGVQVLNAVLETAWANARPAGVELLLAGHTHVFEVLGFPPESGHAMQIIVGNSGTKLAPAMKFDAANAEVRQAQIREFQKVQDFGFTTLRPEGAQWMAEAHDRGGVIRVRCTLPTKEERCAQ